MNRLSFQPVHEEGSALLRVMPCIDGQPLPAQVAAYEAARDFDVQGGYDGVLATGAVGTVQDSPEPDAIADRLFGRTGDGRAILLECMCGVAGCWPLLARIGRSGDVVIWDDFCQPHRPERDYTGFGPFTFAVQPYLQAIHTAVSPGSDTHRSQS